MLGVQLVLTAFLVNLVSISSDQNEPSINSKANYEREMEKSSSSPVPSKRGHDFENFLALAAKKGPNGNLRKILQGEVANGEQEFDLANTEMKAMRSEYAERKRSRSQSQKYLTGNILPVKREVKEPEKCPVDSTKEHREYEEKFVELYGTDNKTSGEWEGVRKTWPNMLPLYHYVHEMHEAAKLLPVGRLSMVLLQKRLLMFKFAPDLSNMTIDLLIYGIENHFKYATVPYWYFVTKGLQKDCVFYLAEEDQNQDCFSLYEHVCGIPEFVPVPSNKSMTTKKPYIWPWQTSPKPARGPDEIY